MPSKLVHTRINEVVKIIMLNVIWKIWGDLKNFKIHIIKIIAITLNGQIIWKYEKNLFLFFNIKLKPVNVGIFWKSIFTNSEIISGDYIFNANAHMQCPHEIKLEMPFSPCSYFHHFLALKMLKFLYLWQILKLSCVYIMFIIVYVINLQN